MTCRHSRCDIDLIMVRTAGSGELPSGTSSDGESETTVFGALTLRAQFDIEGAEIGYDTEISSSSSLVWVLKCDILVFGVLFCSVRFWNLDIVKKELSFEGY